MGAVSVSNIVPHKACIDKERYFPSFWKPSLCVIVQAHLVFWTPFVYCCRGGTWKRRNLPGSLQCFCKKKKSGETLFWKQYYRKEQTLLLFINSTVYKMRFMTGNIINEYPAWIIELIIDWPRIRCHIECSCRWSPVNIQVLAFDHHPYIMMMRREQHYLGISGHFIP